MSDIFTRKKRSALMARVRGRGNLSTELRMITAMRLHGIKGWRRHRPLPGRPDFVFMREKIAVFVDGCFWHGCPIHYTEPRTAADFWREKVRTNRRRDRRVDRLLRAKGWKVVRIWEHDLRGRRLEKAIPKFPVLIALASVPSHRAHNAVYPLAMRRQRRAKSS